MAKTQAHRRMIRLMHAGNLVRFSRAQIDQHTFCGFIAAVSDELLMINTLCDFFLDGYRVLRMKDISEARSGKSERFFTESAIAHGYAPRGGEQPKETIELTDWTSLLRSLKTAGLFVGLHQEELDPDMMQLGALDEIHSEAATLHTCNTSGSWDGWHVQALSRLTMVQFGCRYIHVFQDHLRCAK